MFASNKTAILAAQKVTRHDFSCLPLSNLPLEILEGVGQNLSLPDISCLRLACKSFATKMYGSYIGTFFAERSFLVSDKTTMETLRELTADVGLVKHVRCLRFSVHSLNTNSDIVLLQRCRQDTNRAARTPRLAVRRLYNELKQEEHDFYKTGLAIVLQSIFQNLKMAGICVQISLERGYSTGDGAYSPWGVKRIRDVLGIESNVSLLTNNDDRLYYDEICRAIGEVQYRARGLNMGTQHSLSYTKSPHDLSWFSALTTKLPVSHLRELRTYVEANPLRSRRDVSVHDLDRHQYIHDFVSFIARASNLNVLSIEQGFNMGDLNGMRHQYAELFRDVFHAIGTRTYLNGTSLQLPAGVKLLPKLKTLELVYHMVSLDLLLEFCRQRKNTLDTVILKRLADLGHEHPRAAEQIREVIDATPNARCMVSVEGCWQVRRENSGSWAANEGSSFQT